MFICQISKKTIQINKKEIEFLIWRVACVWGYAENNIENLGMRWSGETVSGWACGSGHPALAPAFLPGTYMLYQERALPDPTHLPSSASSGFIPTYPLPHRPTSKPPYPGVRSDKSSILSVSRFNEVMASIIIRSNILSNLCKAKLVHG